MTYDVIVIGAGHAGCEAALAATRMGLNTLVITGNINMIANMPCNPSIGGPAKGIVVREMDALGGEMGKNADETHIQMRMLNYSKGPAVRALRAQADKIEYPAKMRDKILANCHVHEGYVEKLIVNNNNCEGVILENGTEFKAKTVVITTGTYMEATILVGHDKWSEGPDKQKASVGLSAHLRELGLTTQRLKTGTPARVKTNSINYALTEEHPGDSEFREFSFDTEVHLPLENQISCWLTYTTEETQRLIEDNLKLSAMYSGNIVGVGPRYCPSIEDKIVRFNDKPRHQIFLEPESKHLDQIYVQGFSTSMPIDVQDKMLRSVIGLENVEVIRYAYAIEYDAIDATELYPTLESKIINNLFFGGQVNGTSGYEEAACQGLMAGINAALKVKGEEPLVLRRDEAYIGVLIDDLVTKGTKEPYRLLTSRAEFRLLLRHDNADIRLRHYGRRIGLIDDVRYEKFTNKLDQIAKEKERLASIELTGKKDTNEYLDSIGSAILRDRITLLELLKRPEITYENCLGAIGETPTLPKAVYEQVEIDTKYEGYIKKMIKEADKLSNIENKVIPKDIDYTSIINLSLEAREKLTKIRPLNIGQASRISGVTPSDISILLVYIKTMRREG